MVLSAEPSCHADTSRAAGCRNWNARQLFTEATKLFAEKDRGSNCHDVYRRSVLEIPCLGHRGPDAGGLFAQQRANRTAHAGGLDVYRPGTLQRLESRAG